MKLKIEPEIFEQYPDVVLGVVIADNVDNKGSNEEINSLLRDAETNVIKNFEGVQVTEHPNILPWRDAYRKFGAKPKDYPSSIENLIRRVSKGEQVRHINNLVDIYNYISLKYLVPVGGEDINNIVGDVSLAIAKDNEKPIFLLGEKEARSPHPGEVIYKDDNGAICRRWNWKEADRTKLTEDTTNVVLVIEGLPPVDKNAIVQAIKDLASLVEKYCNATTKTAILTKESPEIELK